MTRLIPNLNTCPRCTLFKEKRKKRKRNTPNCVRPAEKARKSKNYFRAFHPKQTFFLNFEVKRAESSKLHEIARNQLGAVAISGIGCMVKHRFERGNFNAGQKQHTAISK
mgnify:CR=1 FL=1